MSVPVLVSGCECSRMGVSVPVWGVCVGHECASVWCECARMFVLDMVRVTADVNPVWVTADIDRVWLMLIW